MVIKNDQEKMGVPNLLCRYGTTGNGYVHFPDTRWKLGDDTDDQVNTWGNTIPDNVKIVKSFEPLFWSEIRKGVSHQTGTSEGENSEQACTNYNRKPGRNSRSVSALLLMTYCFSLSSQCGRLSFFLLKTSEKV